MEIRTEKISHMKLSSETQFKIGSFYHGLPVVSLYHGLPVVKNV